MIKFVTNLFPSRLGGLVTSIGRALYGNGLCSIMRLLGLLSLIAVAAFGRLSNYALFGSLLCSTLIGIFTSIRKHTHYFIFINFFINFSYFKNTMQYNITVFRYNKQIYNSIS